jgi:histidine ammonia-lyase
MAQVLDGHSLKIEDAVRIARNREPIALHKDAVARIQFRSAANLLEHKIQTREVIYGVNTGIAELSEVVLTPEQVEKFQR